MSVSWIVSSPRANEHAIPTPFDIDELPTPVAQAVDAWMKASKATAIIVCPIIASSNIYNLILMRIPQTALLAGVQSGMIAVLEALPDSDDSTLWRTYRFFVYAGLLFDLGATLSSVYITVQGAALPALARWKVTDDAESTPYRHLHGPNNKLDSDYLDGRHGPQLLREFGMGNFWKFIAYHMLWNFVLGYICLILSIILWVCGRELPALIIPIVIIAVGALAPVYGFLRFILPV